MQAVHQPDPDILIITEFQNGVTGSELIEPEGLGQLRKEADCNCGGV